MLFTQHISRNIATIASGAILICGFPACAEGNPATSQPAEEAGSKSSARKSPVLIAQATCADCGAELNPLILSATQTDRKNFSPLTDSLWGNLILDLAYSRDKELQKIARRMNLVSLGTMASIGAISGGTLAQSIIGLKVLNPADGHQDSYTPLIVGTVLSGVTLMVFLARMGANHRLANQIIARQTVLKKKVENILTHMERCGGKCAEAKKELTELIGERACREWVGLYQSSHQVAMTSPHRFSTLEIPGHTL